MWPESTEENAPETIERDAVTNEVLAESSAVFSLDENEISEWLHCDDNEEGYQLLTDDEIIEMATEIDVTDSDNDTDAEYDVGDVDEETATAKDLRTKAREAASHMQQFIDWYSKQKDANKVDCMILRRLRNSAVL